MNKDQKRDYNRKYAAEHREQRRAYARAWYHAHPENIERYRVNDKPKRVARKANTRVLERLGHVGRTYNLTPEQYQALLDSQGNRCAICGESRPEHESLCVDHDHETGKIRGLLCRQCNSGIGNLRDDPNLIRLALTYLTKDTDHETQ